MYGSNAVAEEARKNMSSRAIATTSRRVESKQIVLQDALWAWNSRVRDLDFACNVIINPDEAADKVHKLVCPRCACAFQGLTNYMKRPCGPLKKDNGGHKPKGSRFVDASWVTQLASLNEAYLGAKTDAADLLAARQRVRVFELLAKEKAAFQAAPLC